MMISHCGHIIIPEPGNPMATVQFFQLKKKKEEPNANIVTLYLCGCDVDTSWEITIINITILF